MKRVKKTTSVEGKSKKVRVVKEKSVKGKKPKKTDDLAVDNNLQASDNSSDVLSSNTCNEGVAQVNNEASVAVDTTIIMAGQVASTVEAASTQSTEVVPVQSVEVAPLQSVSVPKKRPYRARKNKNDAVEVISTVVNTNSCG